MKAQFHSGDRVSFLFLEATPDGSFYCRRKRYLGTYVGQHRGMMRVHADRGQEGLTHPYVLVISRRDSVKHHR